jgi:hypothetical protein
VTALGVDSIGYSLCQGLSAGFSAAATQPVASMAETKISFFIIISFNIILLLYI